MTDYRDHYEDVICHALTPLGMLQEILIQPTSDVHDQSPNGRLQTASLH